MTPEERLARLLRLMVLLQGKAVRNARDIAGELDISERTAHRDLKALAMAGVPVDYLKEGSAYRSVGDFPANSISVAV